MPGSLENLPSQYLSIEKEGGDREPQETCRLASLEYVAENKKETLPLKRWTTGPDCLPKLFSDLHLYIWHAQTSHSPK